MFFKPTEEKKAQMREEEAKRREEVAQMREEEAKKRQKKHRKYREKNPLNDELRKFIQKERESWRVVDDATSAYKGARLACEILMGVEEKLMDLEKQNKVISKQNEALAKQNEALAKQNALILEQLVQQGELFKQFLLLNNPSIDKKI